MKNYNHLELEKKGPVLWVYLNRPYRANSFNAEMISELTGLADSLRYEEDIKFVVFTARGAVFSSGVDLKEVYELLGSTDSPHTKVRLDQFTGQEMVRKLESIEQVTIAAINGLAYGAGLVLAMACDFRVADESAILCIPETNVGRDKGGQA